MRSICPPSSPPARASQPSPPRAAAKFDLPDETAIIAGTTDGCAAFLASGASEPGDGVTSLGTTLTLKLLSAAPVFAPQYGIYSHRIGDTWLAGGASNSGGQAIMAHFSRDEIERLTPLIDPDKPTGLDYYPLARPGERFPINDPALAPRLEPRPAEPRRFLQAMLEGIANIEALGYRRLAELGANPLATIRTVGGGAVNETWTQDPSQGPGRSGASCRELRMLAPARRDWPGGASMQRLDHLSAIAGHFGGILIDQFGVIHDGEKLYPGVLDTLENLKRAQVPVVVMTNSGKRAEANRRRLVAMGLDRALFVDAMSSGEVAYRHLATSAPRHAYIIGRDGEDYGFDNVEIVADPHDAEVLLILGSNAPKTSLDEYRKLFSGLAIPALCCNPDKLMLTRDGLQPAPGAIASLYEEMGGKVEWIGKPYPEIYRAALSLIGNPAQALAIGDSAEHDVAGGRRAGISTLLVRTGLSAGLDRFEPEPDYLMDNLTW